MVVTEVADALKSNEILLDVEAPPHEEDEREEWGCLKMLTVSSTGLSRFSCRIEGTTIEREECGDICDSSSVSGR